MPIWGKGYGFKLLGRSHMRTYDFVQDLTVDDGHRRKWLMVWGKFMRQRPCIEIARWLSGTDVKRVLALLFAVHGCPPYRLCAATTVWSLSPRS